MNKMKSFFMCILAIIMTVSILPMPVYAKNKENVKLDRYLIPKPFKFYQKDGVFTLNRETKILVETSDSSKLDEIKNNIIKPLHDKIKVVSGYDLSIVQNQEVNQNVIKIKLLNDDNLKEEGYRLNVATEGVQLEANKPAGLFRGLQTLRQLFPSEIEKQSLSEHVQWELPNCDITDLPRYEYRGTMLDISRHFFNKDEIKRQIDLASQYKINKFHLHLSDDQGWRLEMKGEVNGESLSKLTKIGASTSVSINGIKSGYLKQEDFAEIVNYAKEHYIEIIPEFDMPGHSWAALVSMETLNSTENHKPNSDKYDNTKPYEGIDVGFSSFECNNENTYKFIEEVIRQVSEISPSKYIHIGGDESNVTSKEDYTKFFDKVTKIAHKYGKVAIGWQEYGKVLSEENKQNSVVQYWKFPKEEFAKGIPYIVSPGDHAYLDMQYDSSSKYGLHWAGYVNTEKAYNWDPTDYGDESQILGVEAPLWSETVATSEALDYMIYPRLIGIAEIGWSQKDGRSWDEYKTRLKSHGKRLAYEGIQFYQDQNIWYQTDKDKIQNYEDSLTGSTNVDIPNKRGATPNKNQMSYYKDELAAFIHFGPNTFTGKEWGNGTEDEIKAFDPTELNTDQWVKTLKDAGFKKVIVTAKHHDGFQLWPSQYSDKNVKASGFADRVGKDKVDVLEMLSTSCTKFGMDMGLYLSPWDMSETSYGQPVEILNDKNEVVMKLDENGHIVEGTDKTNVGDVFWGKVKPLKGKEDKNGDYNSFYLNQLKEVLENPKYGRNGRFTEIWMDGAKNDVRYQEYDLQQWWDLCRKLEPGVLIFNNIGNEVRWIGNERGYSYDPIWGQVSKEKLWNDYNLGCNSKPNSDYPSKIRIVNNTDHRTGKNFKTWTYADSYEDGGYLQQGDPNGDLWSIPESDSSIIGGWFWSERAPQTGKELVEKYFQSVGNAAPMLLNTPPNRKGLLEESYIKSLTEFRSILDNTFKTNLAQNAKAIASSTYKNSPTYKASNVTNSNFDSYWAAEDGTTGNQQITVFLDGVQQFDLIDIKEYVPLGQNVSDYEVEVRVNGKWNAFGKTGNTKKAKKTIGYRSILRDNTVNADAIRLTIKNSYGSVKISEIGAYKMDERIEFTKGSTIIPQGIKNNFIPAHSTERTGYWNLDDSDTVRINSMSSNDPNATATYKFTGSRFFLSSRYSFNFGAMMVSIDNGPEFEVNLNDPTCTISSIVYYSDTLSQGQHTVRIRPTTKNGKNWIASDGLFYLDNEEAGMFEIEKTNLEVVESKSSQLIINRVGGSKGEVSVRVSTKPGSAVHGRHYKDVNKVVTFKNGETKKVVELPTVDNAEQTGTLDYSVELSEATKAILGFNTSATINILDNEVNTKHLEEKIKQASSLNKEDYEEEIWNNLQDIINQAKEFLKQSNLNQKEVDKYCIRFDDEMKYIRKKGTYTIINLEEGTSIEAEECELGGGATVYKKSSEPDAWKNLSGTGMVGDINENGNVTAWIYFPKAGDYSLNVQYYAGAENQVHFTNGKTGNKSIEKVLDVKVGLPGNTETLIKVKEPGLQGFKFIKNTGISKDHANLDKFTFTYKQVDAKELVLSTSSMNLESDKQQLIKATITPENATQNNIVWNSSNEQVATVTKDGMVQAKGRGEAIITATIEGTKISATCKINVTVDTKALEVKMDEAKKVSEIQYTKDSYSKLVANLENANKTLSKQYLTSSDVKKAIDTLQVSLDGLVRRGNVDELNKVVTANQNRNKDDYKVTEEQWKEFQFALLNAQAIVADNSNSSQEDVEHAKLALEKAIVTLKYKDADYSKVDAAIAKVKALYKEDYTNFSEVEKALANVKEGLDITKQKEVDAMAYAIEDAISGLKVNKDQLNKEISKAPKDEWKYTNVTWKTYQKILENAKKIVIDDNATLTQVKEAIKALQDAYNGLKENSGLTPIGPSEQVIPMTPLKPSTPVDSTETEKPSTTDKVENVEKPNTGVSTNAALLWSVLLGAGVLVISLTNKKRKNQRLWIMNK